MPSKLKVGYPVTDRNDSPLNIEEGASLVLSEGGGMTLIIGRSEPGRFQRASFRSGQAGVGAYRKEAVPFFLFRLIPAGEDEANLGEKIGDLRVRAPLNLHRFEGEMQEAFLRSEDRAEEYVTVTVLYLNTEPDGSAPNLLLGIRDEKIRRHRMTEIREAGEDQLSRYENAQRTGAVARQVMRNISLDEMMERATLTTDGGRMLSLAGEEV